MGWLRPPLSGLGGGRSHPQGPWGWLPMALGVTKPPPWPLGVTKPPPRAKPFFLGGGGGGGGVGPRG
jgi:hypothetical protein